MTQLDDIQAALNALIATVGPAGAGLTAIPAPSFTLSQVANTVAHAQEAGAITCHRGDTFSAKITGLGSLVGYTSIYFTAKNDLSDPDTASVIQIKKAAAGSDGLKYLVGAAVANGDVDCGSIVIDDINAGNITINLTPAKTALLTPNTISYDVQVANAGAVLTKDSGLFVIEGDFTRAIS